MQENVIKVQPKAFLLSDAARYVGLSQGGLRWAIFNKRGPKTIRIGKRLLFRVEDLDAWLAENVEEVSND